MNNVNYDIFVKNVRDKVMEEMKNQNVPCNAVGAGYELDHSEGEVLIIAVDTDEFEIEGGNVFPFLFPSISTVNPEVFAKDFVQSLKKIVG